MSKVYVGFCPYCGSENVEWMGDALGDDAFHCHECDTWFDMQRPNNTELYDDVCRVLTWYENPEEYPCGEDNFNKHISEEMYKVLVRVQNELF